jgi:RNAse (barnase) inhibitor barstar
VLGFIMFNKALIALVVVLFSLQAMAAGTTVINGKNIKNREQLYATFSKELNLTKTNAKSLETLYENLTSDVSGSLVIKIKNLNLLKLKIGSDYIDALVNVVVEASEENSKIVFVLE